MENIIINVGNGWYDFTKLNQSGSYMKICNLRCVTDEKAIKQARSILHNQEAIIEVREVA